MWSAPAADDPETLEHGDPPRTGQDRDRRHVHSDAATHATGRNRGCGVQAKCCRRRLPVADGVVARTRRRRGLPGVRKSNGWLATGHRCGLEIAAGAGIRGRSRTDRAPVTAAARYISDISAASDRSAASLS